MRQRRIFSEAIKKRVVGDIERGMCTVLEASRELGVSINSVYQWVHKYSAHLKKNRVLVVEDKSEAYRSKELERRIRDLEAMVGRKQMEVDLLNALIAKANEAYKTDIKKNFSNRRWNGFVSKKGKNTDTK